MKDGPREANGIPYGIPAPGFRLSPGTRPGRVDLQVSELERSLGYYEGVLGFRTLDRSGSRALLGAEDSDVPLVELDEQSGAAAVPRRRRLGLFHFAILLPDRPALGAFVRHLRDRGESVGASDHRVSEALYLQDPDGLGIEVYADRPRSEWAHRDRQIIMATDPLDLVALARAAGSESWAGMPAGTRIGHVHLHVGDLDVATAFYHEALGLDKMVWSYPGALFLSAGGYHHHLGVNTWAGAAQPPGENEPRLLAWELVVPSAAEVDEVAASVRSAGFPVDRAAEGPLARDPWGTALRIRARR